MKVRAVIDTNVVVSGILSANQSYPCKILDCWITETVFLPLMSSDLKKEIKEVLMRPKINGRIPISRDIDVLLPVLFAKSEMIKVKRIRSRVFPDKKDHFLYELAVSGKAEIIVTGDDELLLNKEISGIRLVNAKEFCEKHYI